MIPYYCDKTTVRLYEKVNVMFLMTKRIQDINRHKIDDCKKNQHSIHHIAN